METRDGIIFQPNLKSWKYMFMAISNPQHSQRGRFKIVYDKGMGQDNYLPRNWVGTHS